MTPETLTALRASIQHWRENVAISDIENADVCVTSCALCGMFWRDDPWDDCDGCPIALAEHPKCTGTPYDTAMDANKNDDLPAFLAAAQAELDFLISLLPEGATP